MDIVQKMPARVLIIQFIQKTFARVREGGMPDIVPERNRLDKFQIQMQRLTDITRNTGHELHVQATPSHIVVFIQRIHLRFVCVTAEIRTMNYLFNVAYNLPLIGKIRTRFRVTAKGIPLVKGKGRNAVFLR